MVPALLLAFALVCLGFPSYDWYFDGLTFAMAAEGVAAGGNPAWLLHPHHLLYTPLAYAAYRLIGEIVPGRRAGLVMQWLSTLCAVAGLAIFHGLLARLEVPRTARLAGVALLGASCGWWQFATQGDTTMPEALTLLALLAVSVRADGRTAGTSAVILGLLQGGAMLIHESAVLFVPAAGWALWRSAKPGSRMRAIAAYLGVAAGVTAAAYLAAGVYILRVPVPAGLLKWMAGYFGADPRTGYVASYGAWAPANIPASARGWLESLVGTWPGPAGPLAWGWCAGAAACAAAILVLAALGARSGLTAGAGSPARIRHRARAVEVVLVWLGTHAAFFTWWMPGHARFWVLALPGWILLALLGADARWNRHGRLPRLLWLPAAGLVLLVGLGPFRHDADPACNRFLPVAETLAARTPPDATIVISGVGEWTSLKAYIPYVAVRRMFILDWQFADPAVPPARALAALASRIEAIGAAGKLYWLSEAADPALDAHFLLQHRIRGADLRALFAARRPRKVADLAPGLALYRL